MLSGISKLSGLWTKAWQCRKPVNAKRGKISRIKHEG